MIRGKLSRLAVFCTLAGAWLTAFVFAFGDFLTAAKIAEATHGSGPHLMIMWDGGGSAPTGWSYVSDSGGDLYQLMPRGAASYGGTGGSDIHTPTLSYVGEAAGATAMINPAGSTFAPGVHSHGSFAGSLVTIGSSLPTYSSLRFIEYNAGIPTQIPSGGIVMFDASVPTGFTQYSSQDGLFIRGDATAGSTGGAASHLHNFTFSLTALPGVGRGTLSPSATVAATSTHGHGNVLGASSSLSHDPPHVQVILGKATSTVALPNGMIGMFDDTVSSPWTTLSGSGGVFENRYIKADTTYATALGNASHTHANQAVNSATPSASGAANVVPATFPAASGTHTHSVTVSYSSSNNAPAYRDVVIAQYDPAYTPVTKNWRWFDAEDVANPNTTNGGDTTTGDAMASENSVPSPTRIVYLGNAMKLRVVIGDTGGFGGTDVKFWLQYAFDPGFVSATDVGDQGSITEKYRYYNGANVSDDDPISTTRLSGSPTAGRHNEDKTTGGGAGGGSTFDPAASTDYEHEFTIQNFDHDVGLKTFYFRVRYCENSVALCIPGTVALGSGQTGISLASAAAYDLEIAAAPSSVQFGTYSAGGGGTLSYTFQGGEEISFWDKRGTLAAYDVTVGAMSMDCCSGGDTIPGTDITWTSTTGVLSSAFASNSTGFTGNTGQDLSTTRNAYSAASSSTEVRRGGFYFLPTVDFVNLDLRTAGTYSDDLVITIL